jgi:hypothetical protein
LIYFANIAYFRPADRQVESEPVENFQDLKQQPAGFEGNCP